MVFAGRLLGWATWTAAMLGAVAVVAMMLHIVADVVMKNVFSRPIPLTGAIVSNWYMVPVAFLPLALAERLNRHIAVELLFTRLPVAARRWAGAAVCLAAAVIAGGVTSHLWGEAMKRFRSGTFVVEQSVSLPTWPMYFVLPIGFGLMTAVLLYRVAVLVSGRPGGLGEASFDDDAASHVERG